MLRRVSAREHARVRPLRDKPRGDLARAVHASLVRGGCKVHRAANALDAKVIAASGAP